MPSSAGLCAITRRRSSRAKPNPPVCSINQRLRPAPEPSNGAVLRSAGLVGERRDGRFRLYRLQPEPLREVADWVAHYEKFWKTKLAALGELLAAIEQRQAGAKTKTGRSRHRKRN